MTFALIRRIAIGVVLVGSVALGVCAESNAQRTAARDPKGDAAKRDAVERPFADGPLTLDDFQAEAPPESRGANLVADVRYQYTYRLDREGAEFVAHMTDIDLFAMAVRHRSWIFDRQDKSALQYPQGHFDITQVIALKCKRLMYEKLLEGETFAGRAEAEQDAIAAMEKNFQKLIQPLMEERSTTQHRYHDAVEPGGAEAEEAIKAQRKTCAEEMSTLAAEIKKLAAKAASRRPRR